jgi:hypothetical protein
VLARGAAPRVGETIQIQCCSLLTRPLQRHNPLQLRRHLPLRHHRVMPRLQPQPSAIRQAEKPAQPQIRVGGDAAFAGDDAADALRGHADAFGEAVFAHADGIEEFLSQHFAGGDGGEEFCYDRHSSVIINNFNNLPTFITQWKRGAAGSSPRSHLL